MKLLLIAITTLVSVSLGGGSYNPNALNTALLAFSDSATQSTQQTPEISSELRAQIDRLSSSNPVDRAEAACKLGELKASASIPALVKLLSDDTEVTQPVCGERHKWGDSNIPKTTPGEMAAVALSRMGRQAV